jgi:hypothetical protein
MRHHHHGEAKRDFDFTVEDNHRPLESVWKEAKIGDILPWENIADEAKRLLVISKVTKMSHRKVATMKSRKMIKKYKGTNVTPTTK